MGQFREIVESILYNNLLFESEQKVNWILSQPKLVQALESRIQNDSKAPDGITVEQLLKNFDNNSVAIGKFLPWVVKMYSKGEFEYTDLGLVNNYLKDFVEKSHKLEKKDINSYKSLEELNNALKDIKDVKGSREAKRDAKSSAEKVYEDDEWVIIAPHTKEAAIQYGKGTKWCTAALNANYFNQYYNKGKLYIIINKQNPSEKYQFHFETSSYMDAKDQEIDISSFLEENPGIRKFFKSIRDFDKYKYTNWPWFDASELDYEKCAKTVNGEGEAFIYLPKEFRDYNMCLNLITGVFNGRAIRYIPDKFKDYNLYLQFVKTHGSWALEYVPEKFKDYNMYLGAVTIDPYALESMPKQFKDYNMYLEAVKHDSSALELVPNKFKDYNMYLTAVRRNLHRLDDTPKEFRNKIKQELGIK